MSLLGKLHQANARLAERDADPLRGKVAATVRGMEAISTVSLLDLIGLPKTTGNARRISGTMRSLGFVPIKSRRLVPGGWRNTECRGWARPVRGAGSRTSFEEGKKVGIRHLNTSMRYGTDGSV
jgi:hypothetical protein